MTVSSTRLQVAGLVISTRLERDTELKRYEVTGANLSPDERHRYHLMRRWKEGPSAVFVMLNPSKADAFKDDPTIRRCVGFADAIGCGELDVVNLYSLRATDPDELLVDRDLAIGVLNDPRILVEAQRADWVICAWGCHPIAAGRTGSPHGGRGDKVATVLLDAGIKLHALQLTQKGFPAHPLFLPGHLRPQPFHPTRRAA